MSVADASSAPTMPAVFIEQTGGPEVLVVGRKPEPAFGAQDVLIDVVYTGINYIDTYHRTGLYKVPLPFILGREGAGIVRAVGAAVTGFAAGDRVAFVAGSSYAGVVAVPQSKVVLVPAGVSLASATAYMLQGLTCHYLVRSSYRVQPGDTVLVHAGAGGTGGLLVQACKALGATVIATVSSPAKAAVARALGADHVIDYKADCTPATVDEPVRALTGGVGVHAVFDGVGKDTWEASMRALRKRGTLVLFGNASGPVPPVDPLLLTKYGSISMTRPSLVDFLLDRAEFQQRCDEVFAWAASGAVKVSVHATLPLAQAAEAHALLESRAATGKILLLVDEARKDE